MGCDVETGAQAPLQLEEGRKVRLVMNATPGSWHQQTAYALILRVEELAIDCKTQFRHTLKQRSAAMGDC